MGDTQTEGRVQEELRNTEEVIFKGDADLNAPITVKKIDDKGYAYVWDTRTYEKLPVIFYMLERKLRQRREDGSFRFTLQDPQKQPVHGNVKCMLHEDHPNRKHYEELGFRTCPADRIRNEYELKLHMQKKHPKEWQTIKDEEETKQKNEDRELQRLLLRSQLKDKEEEAPLYVSDKDKIKDKK